MKKHSLIIIGLALGLAVPAFAQQKETSATPPDSEQAKQIVALVEKASTLIDSKGKSSFPEFRKTGSEWRTGDTYLFVNDLKGMVLFNGGFPENEGSDFSGRKDSNGKVFVAEFVKVVQSKGSGWVDYTFPKPGQSQPSPKWSYVKAVNVDGTPALVGAGFYAPSQQATGQQKTLKELIVGTWLLDSVYDQTQDGEKHNPWGDGVKGQAIFTSDGNLSWQIMSANRPKADTSLREPVGPVVAYWGTYTVDEAAKTLTEHKERCTWPQWDGYTGTLNLAFPTENELNMTTLEPIPDPKMGPFVPHLNWKRAVAESVNPQVSGGLTVPAFAQTKEDIRMLGTKFDAMLDEDRETKDQLDGLTDRFINAFESNDATQMKNVFAANAVCVTPKGPLHGQAEIESYFADLFKNGKVIQHWVQVEESSMQTVGPDKVWRTGEYCNTVQLPDGKHAIQKGFWSAVEVKDGDTWKHLLLTFNVTPNP